MSIEEIIHILAQAAPNLLWRETDVPWIQSWYAEDGLYILKVREHAAWRDTYAFVEAGSSVEAVNKFLDLKVRK